MPNATPQAEELAKELDIDVEQVPGSGEEGRVTKPDVEKFAEGQNVDPPEEGGGGGAQPPSRFYAKLNPQLGSDTSAVVVGERTFYPGERNPRNLVTPEEFEDLKTATDPHGGFRLLLKGGEE